MLEKNADSVAASTTLNVRLLVQINGSRSCHPRCSSEDTLRPRKQEDGTISTFQDQVSKNLEQRGAYQQEYLSICPLKFLSERNLVAQQASALLPVAATYQQLRTDKGSISKILDRQPTLTTLIGSLAQSKSHQRRTQRLHGKAFRLLQTTTV